MTRPIARFTTTATVNNNTTVIAANAIEPTQPRGCSTAVCEFDFAFARWRVFAFVLASVVLRVFRDFLRGEYMQGAAGAAEGRLAIPRQHLDSFDAPV
jgi:hypothetical protein